MAAVPQAGQGRVRVRAEGIGLVGIKLRGGGPLSAPLGAVLWRAEEVPRPGGRVPAYFKVLPSCSPYRSV